MADVELVVGIDIGASLTQFRKDLDKLVSKINKSPPTVKVKLKYDKKELYRLKGLIDSINKAASSVAINMPSLSVTDNGASLNNFISKAEKINKLMALPDAANSRGLASLRGYYSTLNGIIDLLRQDPKMSVNDALKFFQIDSSFMKEMNVAIYDFKRSLKASANESSHIPSINKLMSTMQQLETLRAKVSSKEFINSRSSAEVKKLGADLDSLALKFRNAFNIYSNGGVNIDDAMAKAGLSAKTAFADAKYTMSELTKMMSQSTTSISKIISTVQMLKTVKDAVVSANISKTTGDKNGYGVFSVDSLKEMEGRFSSALKYIQRDGNNVEQALARAGLSAGKSFDDAKVKVNAFKAELSGVEKLVKSIPKLLGEMDENVKNWSAARYGKSSSSYKDYINARSGIATLFSQYETGQIDFNTLRDGVSKFSGKAEGAAKVIKSMGEDTKSLAGRLDSVFKKFPSWLTAARIISIVTRSLRQMLKSVYDIDAAMLELRKVTDASEATYNNFFSRATTRATSLGVSVKDTINATADFARLGYNVEEASKLADVALIYKNVGDGIENISTASESIIATVQAFGLSANDSMAVVDKFNEVGNNFAISSKGVGEALVRSAAAMKVAGNTLDETIALATAANTVVQDPTKVGTVLKTVSMYLRAAKTEAEDAGESTDGMASSVSKLREEVLLLTGQKVDIQLDENTFKSTYQIIKEISQVWGDISDISRANLLERLGGKRNANVVAALLDNFSVAERALESSMDSANSALIENEKRLNSLTGRVSIFKAELEKLSTNIFNSEVVKGVVDFGTALLRIVGLLPKATSYLGGLKSVVTVVAGILTSKILRAGKGGFLSLFSEILDDKEHKMHNLVYGIDKVAKKAKDCFESFALGFSVYKDDAKGVLWSLRGGFKSLIDDIGAANFGIMAVTAATTAAIAIYQKWERDRQKTIADNQQIIDNNQSKISSGLDYYNAVNAYEMYAKQVSLTATEESVLKTAVDSINNALTEKGVIIDGLTTKTDDYISTLKKQAEYEELLNTVEVTRGAAANKLVAMASGERGFNKQYEFVTQSAAMSVIDIYKDVFKYKAAFNTPSNILASLSYPDAKADVTADFLVDWYYALLDEQTRLIDEGYQESKYFGHISSKISEYQSSIEQYLEAQVTEQMLETSSSFAESGKYLNTQENFEEYRTQIINTLGEKYSFDDKNSDLLKDLVDKYLSKNKSFEGFLSKVKQRESAEKEIDKMVSDLVSNGKLVKDSELSEKVAEKLKEINESSPLSVGLLNDIKKAFTDGLIKTDGELDSFLQKWTLTATETAYQSRVLHKSYSELQAGVEASNSVLSHSAELFRDKTYISEDLYNSIVSLAGGEAVLSKCIDTSNGYLITNAKALANIISSSNSLLNENIKLAESHEMLEYHRLAKELDSVTKGLVAYDDETRNSVEAIRESIEQIDLQIAKYKLLRAQLSGGISGFIKLADAKETDEFFDYTDDLNDAISTLLTGYQNEEFGSLSFKAAFDALVPEDYLKDCKDAAGRIEKGKEYIDNVLSKYYTLEDSDSKRRSKKDEISTKIERDDVSAFFDKGLKNGVFEGTMSDFKLSDEIETLDDFANKMGVTTEVALAFGNALSKYNVDGVDFLNQLTTDDLEGRLANLDYRYEQALQKRAQILQNNEVGSKEWRENEWEIVGILKEQSNAADEARRQIAKAKPNDDAIKAKQKKIEEAYRNLSKLSEGDEGYNAALENFEALQEELTDLLVKKQEIGTPTELTIEIAKEKVESEIAEVQAAIDSFDAGAVKAFLNGDVYVGEDGRKKLETKLKELQDELIVINGYVAVSDNDVMNTLKTVEEFVIHDKEFSVKAIIGVTISVLEKAKWLLEQLKDKTITVKTKVVTTALGKVFDVLGKKEKDLDTVGEAGYKGNAFARGKMLLNSSSQKALVGELGRELVVDPNRNQFFTVGDNGAEFVRLPPNAIIFNHRQTEHLLNNSLMRGSGRSFAGSNFIFADRDFKATGSAIIGNSIGTDAAFSTVSGKLTKSGSEKSNDSKVESQFETLYKYHKHLLALSAESMSEYLDWLTDAYKEAYEKGEITLDEFRTYEEEVFAGTQSVFKDYINNIEHEISMRGYFESETKNILKIYSKLMKDIEKEIASARAAGLKDSDSYIQELLKQYFDYGEKMKEINKSVEEEAKDATEKLVDFRIDMIEKELGEEKDALNKKLSNIGDFYSKQLDLLRKAKDEEKYLEEQAELRKSVSDIEDQLAQIEHDDSTWAQRRRVELKKELADAQKDLRDFESDKAIELAEKSLEEAQKHEEEAIETQITAIEALLDNKRWLYVTALNDIRNGNDQLLDDMIAYNDTYGNGKEHEIVKMWEDAYAACEKYKELSGEVYRQFNFTNATYYIAPEDSWDNSTLNPNPKPVTQDEPTPSEEAQPSAGAMPAVGSSVTIKGTATRYGSMSNGVRMASFVPGSSFVVSKVKDGQVLVSDSEGYIGWVNINDIEGYAKGTQNATLGFHRVNELGAETLFESSDGNKYRLFSGGEKVLTAKASNFLYNFASTGGEFISSTIQKMISTALPNLAKHFSADNNITMGDIIISGDCSNNTVSEIRRAQKDSVSFMLHELNKLNA